MRNISKDNISENHPSLPNLSNLEIEENSEEWIPLQISDYYNSWEIENGSNEVKISNVSAPNWNYYAFALLKGCIFMILGILCLAIMYISFNKLLY